MHHTLCLFPESHMLKNIFKGPQWNCDELSWPGRSQARRCACRARGWPWCRVTGSSSQTVQEGVHRGEMIIYFFFLHHPQVIHTILLQLCKADFSSRQRLLQDIWGSKSLECFSTGSVVKMFCSERASVGCASCTVPVWQMEKQKAMLFVQGCWEC